MAEPGFNEEAGMSGPLAESYWPADQGEAIVETTIGDALHTAAARWGGRVALVASGPGVRRRAWTFAELEQSAEQVARAVLQRFQPGEHLAVWAANCPEWVLLEMGAALAGVTVVTVNPAYRSAELTHVLGQSKASGIIVQPSYRGRDLLAVLARSRPDLPALREVVDLWQWDEFVESGSDQRRLPTVSPADIAQIQYTSGTTGFPKGAQLSSACRPC